MKQTPRPIRLFIEILLIVAGVQVAVTMAVPLIGAGLDAPKQVFLSAALLLLIAGPAVYWRCMSGTPQAPAAPGGKGSRTGTVRSAIAMTAATQVLGLALTGAGVAWQLRTVSTAAQEKFERRAERIERDVRRHFLWPVYGLNGLRGLFAANGQITHDQLRAWVGSRDLPVEFPGVRGFGFIERVQRDALAAFVAARQADGSPGFAVDTAGNAADLYIVKSIEPLASNHGALGKDVGREAVRREAAERAATSGLPSMSGSISLLQNETRGPGFLLMVPVYQGGAAAAALATPQRRQALLIGLVYAPIVVSEIMKGVTDVAEGTLEIELFQHETMQAGDLLFDSRHDTPGQPAAAPPVPGQVRVSLRRFVVGGRTLTLRAISTPAFEASIDRSSVAFIALGGALASFLMALAVWLLAVGRVRAQRRAQHMTVHLARLARVVQHTSNSVAITDAHMRITWVNAGFTRITGYTLEEASGRTPGELLGSGKADPATLKTLLDAVAAGAACRVEVLNRSKTGRDYWIDTEVQPMRDDAGALIGFMEIGSDVTERRALGEDLKAALVRAEQASVAKGQFLANMSHEIRTPMNAILGMLNLLQKTPLTARQLDYAEKTEGAARSLLGLLNDILDHSKAEAGKMTLDPRPFRLDRLLRDLSVILSANVGAKTIDVLFDIGPDVPRCLLGDDMRLQQVLINLAGNAIKFTAEGEVVLRIRVVERSADDVLLEFAVRDSGIGIAPEHQAHIFDGFSQAEASTTRRFGGTGLGLAICQRLVALMGGSLGLHSTPGEGSTFHFSIRLALAEAAGEAPLPRPPDMGVLRALIIDDNAIAREVFVGMAQSLGWQADAAAGGDAAIALAAARASEGRPYEAVFVDWQMSGLDGWETCQRLLEGARACGLAAPLLFMITAHGRAALAQRSPEEQAILSAFLVKPVTASMLFDAVCDARVALAHPGMLARPALPATGPRLTGMRLLVVEDNVNNQQVAQELLSDEGAHVVLAVNGRLGVDAVAAADPPFDAVLMDLQMPEMDGYTATARIRQHLGLATLPIIAMTANAMASDREACLAAGMNDHVGKPFDLSKLVATLLHHTGRAAARAAPAAGPSGAVPAGLLAQAGQHGIDLEAALGRMGGNSRVYLRTLQSFLKDLATLPDQLLALTQQGRFDEARRLMHTIKGLAGTLGVRSLAQMAARTERALGQAQAPPSALMDTLSGLVQVARRDITQVADALQLSLQQTTPANPPARLAEPGLQELQRSLAELAGLLRAADMRALEVLEQMQRSHGPAVRQALQLLDAATASLDFDQALVHCRALQQRFDQ